MRTTVRLLLLTGAFTAHATGQTPTIVFLVRNAEPAPPAAADAGLSLMGKARASALTEVMSNAGISAIISSPDARAKATVAPLAAKLGIEVTMVPAGTSPAAHAQAVVDAVHKLTGKSILIVGQNNTINLIAAALGGPKLPDLCAGDFDQLFTLEVMPMGPPRFVRSRYGTLGTDPACDAMR